MKSNSIFRPLVSAVFSALQFAGFIGPSQATPHQQQQAAHTSATSFTDTTYAISATLPASNDAAGYGLTSIVYTIIGRVQDFPTYGSTRAVQKFTPIAGAVEKSKGAPDYGNGDIVMADMPADAGQIILKAAEASQNHFSLKITFPDGEVHYTDVLVTGWKLSAAKEGAFMLRTANLEFNKPPVVVAAA